MGAKYGDVIYVDRGGYKHFGIYSGNNKVIHYTKRKIISGIIDETSLKEFLDGAKEYYSVNLTVKNGKIKREDTYHNSPGFGISSCFGGSGPSLIDIVIDISSFIYEHFIKDPVLYSPEETVERARRDIGKGEYNLITHNCEHFAIYCKTGIYDSEQVQQVIEAIWEGIFGSTKNKT